MKQRKEINLEQQIKNLINILNDTDITELSIEKDGLKIQLKRRGSSFYPQEESLNNEPPPQKSQQSPPHIEQSQPQIQSILITSPIVGTFYIAATPNDVPFVCVGTMVKKGQTLCVIEAMKLMNEIESEADGIVSKIFIENGKPVEYGESLFLIELQ